MNLQRIKDKLNYHKLLNRITDSIESDAESLIKKQKPDISEEEVSAFVNSLSEFKKPKHKKLAIHWFLQNTIALPEDHEVVEKAIQFAENKKLDPMTYNDPRELSEQLLDKSINLDQIPQFTNKKVFEKHHITIYDVEDSKEGQQAVRDIINAQYGISRNPWCIIKARYGVLIKESQRFWDKYNKIQRRIALFNGKVIAFSANDSPIESWWDMEDKKHDGIPLPPKKEGDATITEKINHEGFLVETKKEYASGEYELKTYWPNGNLKEESTIEAGANERTAKKWYENGQLESRSSFKDGAEHGLYQSWYENGQPAMSCNYKDGLLHGKCQKWYENGERKSLYNFKDDQYYGSAKAWYENGQLQISCTYEDSQLQGQYQSWYENGQLQLLYNYKNGDMDGLCQKWNKNGDLLSSEVYKKGRIVQKR